MTRQHMVRRVIKCKNCFTLFLISISMACSARQAEHQLAQKFNMATRPSRSLRVTLPEPNSDGTLKSGILLSDEFNGEANERVDDNSVHKMPNKTNKIAKGIANLNFLKVIMICVH